MSASVRHHPSLTRDSSLEDGPHPPFGSPGLRPSRTAPQLAEGMLIRTSHPQVDIVQRHGQELERRWIPDTQTFDYMGLNWANAVIVADEVWNRLAQGPQLPSRADGSLLRQPDGTIFVMHDGRRHRIPDPATFDAMGFDWSSVSQASADDVARIPRGSDLPPKRSVQIKFPTTRSRGDRFPGSGGFMHTDPTTPQSGALSAAGSKQLLRGSATRNDGVDGTEE